MALGIADRIWTVAIFSMLPLATQPITPTETPTQRRRKFRVIQGDLFD